MAEGKSNLGESGVPSQQEQIKFDEIFEEKIDTNTIERQEIDKRICEQCFIDGVMNVIALYFCIVCGRYYCENCFTGHTRSHKYIRAGSKDRELESEIADFVSFMMSESDDESEKKLFEDDVCVCDDVDTEHGLDKAKHCYINGLTGYAYKWWVACNSFNDYNIKVFSLGSNVLQRYIRLGSLPYDVTEIIVENKTTEQDSASCSETVISETDNKPDRKHLLAVTFHGKRYILIIDLGKNPAVIHSKIKTEKRCNSIDFYEGHIYTACRELSRDSPRSVYILSVEGVTLKTFQTDISWSWSSLTVLNGNIYMTDPLNHRVVCYNDEGRVLHEIRIDRSFPQGICVDRSEDKVYVSSLHHNKVYELESDLSRYKPVLDRTPRYMEEPWAICFYNDKLYVGHWLRSESGSHVTVVRLL